MRWLLPLLGAKLDSFYLAYAFVADLCAASCSFVRFVRVCATGPTCRGRRPCTPLLPPLLLPPPRPPLPLRHPRSRPARLRLGGKATCPRPLSFRHLCALAWLLLSAHLLLLRLLIFFLPIPAPTSAVLLYHHHLQLRPQAPHPIRPWIEVQYSIRRTPSSCSFVVVQSSFSPLLLLLRCRESFYSLDRKSVV